MTHTNNNNILLKEQFGFRHKPTHKASYNLSNETVKALNNKKIAGGISVTWEWLLTA